MSSSRAVVLLVLGWCPLAWMTGCGGPKEKATVGIKYAMHPDKGLPPGMKSLAVMQLEAKSEGTAGSEFDEAKWQEIVAEMMHRRITVANEKFGTGLTVADRASTKEVMKEKDLAFSGMAEGAELAEASKLLGVQGLIRGRVIVKIDKQEGKGRTLKAASVMAWARGGGRLRGHRGNLLRSPHHDGHAQLPPGGRRHREGLVHLGPGQALHAVGQEETRVLLRQR